MPRRPSVFKLDYFKERNKLSALNERFEDAQDYYATLRHQYLTDGYSVSRSRVGRARENMEAWRARTIRQRNLVEKLSRKQSMVNRSL